MEAAKETKFGTKVAYGVQMLKLRIHAQRRHRYHTRRWKIFTT